MTHAPSPLAAAAADSASTASTQIGIAAVPRPRCQTRVSVQGNLRSALTNIKRSLALLVVASAIAALGRSSSTADSVIPFSGANLPWYNYGCDFGCGARGGVSDPTVSAALYPVLAQQRGVIRWWMFPGNPWQVTTDGIDANVYHDIDAALALAPRARFDFVLFSSPSAIPAVWLSNPAPVAPALAPLFAHYANEPRILAWEVVNEPEWDIWNGKVAQADVQALVRAIAATVHQNSTALVTVGSATLSGIPLWAGLGLDFYAPHWYDPMAPADNPLVAPFPAADAPVVIGEMYAGPDVDARGRLAALRAAGYAAAWPWSLMPERTADGMRIAFPTTYTPDHNSSP